jgi:hypothetical protein
MLDEMKVQVEIKMRERGSVLLFQSVDDKFAIRRRGIEQEFESFDPGFVNLLAPRRFVAIAEMKAHVPDEFFRVVVRDGFFQVFE